MCVKACVLSVLGKLSLRGSLTSFTFRCFGMGRLVKIGKRNLESPGNQEDCYLQDFLICGKIDVRNFVI